MSNTASSKRGGGASIATALIVWQTSHVTPSFAAGRSAPAIGTSGVWHPAHSAPPSGAAPESCAYRFERPLCACTEPRHSSAILPWHSAQRVAGLATIGLPLPGRASGGFAAVATDAPE